MIDALEQYQKSLEELLIAFNASRYTACERLMEHLENLMRQMASMDDPTFWMQKQSQRMRIHELQSEFYARTQVGLNDLLKKTPKRAQLSKFLRAESC